MAWTFTDDLDSYLAVAGEFLLSCPVRHTVQLVAAETLRVRGSAAYGDVAPLFGWWLSAAGVVGCALLHTPPYPVLLTRLPEGSATALADTLAEHGRQLRGVNAEESDASAFASAWGALTGVTGRVQRRMRLFRLAGLVPARPPVPGLARVAAAIDRDLLERWSEAFTREVDDMAGNVRGAVQDRLSYGGLTLWEVSGVPVSLAGVTRPVAGVVRVGPVYTPPDQRKHGYGGAVTVAVSRAALDAGANEVVLFTDLANPTSNALYQRIGYRPVEDRVVLRFGS